MSAVPASVDALDARALFYLWQDARRNKLPVRRILLPSKRYCDNWNVFVRGATLLYQWAHETGRESVMLREREDLEYLALQMKAMENQ